VQSPDINTKVVAGVVVIDLTGHTSLCGRIDLPDVIGAALQQAYRRFVVDCRNLPYIDSTGLASLTRAYVTVSRHDGVLKFINVAPRVRQLFDMTRLSEVLEIHDSEQAALESFNR
jgi:anti-anti-sigma factor